MTMTNLAYAGLHGTRCPFCGSTNITPTARAEAQGGAAWQPMHCHECNRRWEAWFTLSGYSPLSR